MGETLPEDYQGCTLADGSTSADVGYDCSSGDGTLYAYEENGHDVAYAITGGVIGDSADDDAYGRTYDKCLR